MSSLADTVKLGFYRTPKQFLAMAMGVQHPMDTSYYVESPTSYALPRACFRRFGAGEWPDGLPETSFRATQILDICGFKSMSQHGRPRPSGPSQGDGRASLWPFYQQWALEDPDCNGRNINQKRLNGQICRFGLRMADFILSRTSSLTRAGKASGRFIRPASRSGRFIKASLFESFLKAPRKASSKFS